ncbi:MAG: thioredoxin [Caldilineales bacterium]|nr:thioredoxin [Caldilineales bacterium]MDW8317085.1 thioredoxin [Anaerolineae bacterium]
MNLFKRSNPSAAKPSSEPKVEPIHVTDADFDEVILKSELPAVVDLWADWCGPCHMIAPSVQQLAEAYQGRAVVAKLNVDENPNVPGRYGIMGIPTLLYFKNGKEVDRQVGVTSYANLARKLENLLS